MGFFDIADWRRRLVEDELRRQDEIAKITGIVRRQEQVDRAAQRFVYSFSELDRAQSPFKKMIEDMHRGMEQLRAANAAIDAARLTKHDPLEPLRMVPDAFVHD